MEAVWAEMSRLLPRLPPAYFALHLRMVGLTQTATDTEVSFLHTLADEAIPPLGRAHASVLEHAAHIDAVLTARCKNIDDSTVFGVGGTSVCYAPLGAASTQVGGIVFLSAGSSRGEGTGGEVSITSGQTPFVPPSRHTSPKQNLERA